MIAAGRGGTGSTPGNAMKLLCALGLHHWHAKATRREGTTAYRCDWCDSTLVVHRGRRRQKKRYWFLGAILFSLSAWYVIIALGLTGHTKVLWGAKKVAHGANKAADKIDHRVRRAVGAPERHPS
jgi:hypothetical protein